MSIAVHQHDLYLYMGFEDNCILYLQLCKCLGPALPPTTRVPEGLFRAARFPHCRKKCQQVNVYSLNPEDVLFSSSHCYQKPVVKLVEVVVAVLL